VCVCVCVCAISGRIHGNERYTRKNKAEPWEVYTRAYRCYLYDDHATRRSSSYHLPLPCGDTWQFPPPPGDVPVSRNYRRLYIFVAIHAHELVLTKLVHFRYSFVFYFACRNSLICIRVIKLFGLTIAILNKLTYLLTDTMIPIYRGFVANDLFSLLETPHGRSHRPP